MARLVLPSKRLSLSRNTLLGLISPAPVIIHTYTFSICFCSDYMYPSPPCFLVYGITKIFQRNGILEIETCVIFAVLLFFYIGGCLFYMYASCYTNMFWFFVRVVYFLRLLTFALLQSLNGMMSF